MVLLQSPLYQEITFSGIQEQVFGFDADSDLTWIIQVGTSLRFVFVNLIFLETFVEDQPFGDYKNVGHYVFMYSAAQSRGW